MCMFILYEMISVAEIAKYYSELGLGMNDKSAAGSRIDHRMVSVTDRHHMADCSRRAVQI